VRFFVVALLVVACGKSPFAPAVDAGPSFAEVKAELAACAARGRCQVALYGRCGAVLYTDRVQDFHEELRFFAPTGAPTGACFANIEHGGQTCTGVSAPGPCIKEGGVGQ